MRLFGKIDHALNRFDRAQWLTCPFDLAFAAPMAAIPRRTFPGPPRGTTFDPLHRGTNFVAPPRGGMFQPREN